MKHQTEAERLEQLREEAREAISKMSAEDKRGFLAYLLRDKLNLPHEIE